MIFEFGKYKVDIDVMRTASFFETALRAGETCPCDGCQNFDKASYLMPEELKVFFKKMGTDLAKPSECFVYYKDEDGQLLYGGFYHLCGAILEAPEGDVSEGQEDRMYTVNEDFKISFLKEVDLLEEGFPEPVIQMEFLARIPWTLNKENSYN